jgi:hypothetical protein
MPLDSCTESINAPFVLIVSKVSIILRWALLSVNFVRRDPICFLFVKIVIQIIAVICLITNTLIRLYFNQLKFKSQRDLRHITMVHSMSTNSNLKASTVNNGHFFHEIFACYLDNALIIVIGLRKCGVSKTLRFINITLLAQRVCILGQHISKHFISAPLLNTTLVYG